MTKKKTRKERAFLEHLHDELFGDDPARLVELEEARASAEVTRQVYELRTQAGLTQRELARLVGTQHSVISRLEDDDYRGHSLSMLRRIAAAVGKRVEIRFVRLKRRRA
jgi:DNA-binding XRE family transcriptional regulator